MYCFHGFKNAQPIRRNDPNLPSAFLPLYFPTHRFGFGGSLGKVSLNSRKASVNNTNDEDIRGVTINVPERYHRKSSGQRSSTI
jgi:hypothetical protein